MSLHLQRQIGGLKRSILVMGARVEEAVDHAIRAAVTRDVELAQAVRDTDTEIDALQVEIEEECLHTLALHQPVAFDIRYVIATLKISGELERMGDLASNIARLAISLVEQPEVDQWPFDIHGMASLVRTMVSDALDALVNIDPNQARGVRTMDDGVDRIHAGMYRQVERAIREDPELVQTYIQLLGISRNLERLADHAVKIAADVVYMADGTLMPSPPPSDPDDKALA